jgi:hypothetical protein
MLMVRSNSSFPALSLLFTTLLAAGAKYIEPWRLEGAMQLAGFVASFGFITFLVFTVRLPGGTDAWPFEFCSG